MPMPRTYFCQVKFSSKGIQNEKTCGDDEIRNQIEVESLVDGICIKRKLGINYYSENNDPVGIYK